MDQQTGALLAVIWWSGECPDMDAGFPVMTTAGTHDEAGVEVEPPVFDQNWHANLRRTAEVFVDLGIETSGTYAMPNGTELFGAVDAESGQTVHGAPPSAPQRRWA